MIAVAWPAFPKRGAQIAPNRFKMLEKHDFACFALFWRSLLMHHILSTS
jgi:hypothetical protein